MIQNVGISIFTFGNKLDLKTGKTLEANGMVEEFEISFKHGVIPIPVGVTGFTAKKNWEEVMSEFEKYVPDSNLKKKYELIGDEKQTDETVIRTVIEIVNELEKRKR